MKSSKWLLIFPPLITSNWGSYYPSIAGLAAVLLKSGHEVIQMDLNEEFLDFLIDHKRLEKLDNSFNDLGHSSPDLIPYRSAVKLLLEDRSNIIDANSRHLSFEPGNDFDLVKELARSYHIDFKIEDITNASFLKGPYRDIYNEFYYKSNLCTVLNDSYDAVGISVPMGPQLGPCLFLIEYIKNLFPKLKVVVGGPVFTLMDPAHLQLIIAKIHGIDAIVKFEGEIPILALAAQISQNNWSPGAITNVIDKSTQINSIPTKVKGSPPRVSALPLASYDWNILDRLSTPKLSVLQARGCYWGNCAYCDFIELYSNKEKYNGNTVSKVIQEIENLSRTYKVKDFWLITEALPPVQGFHFANELIERKMNISWRSFAMVDPKFTTDILHKFVQSGCMSLTIGLESMNTRVLKLVRKKSTLEDNICFLENAQKVGLKLDINLIPNLPTTTHLEALHTLELLTPFKSVFRTVSVFPFEATSSSDIGKSPLNFGLELVENKKDELFPKGQAQFCSNRLLYKDNGMSEEELADIIYKYEIFSHEIRELNTIKYQFEKNGFKLRSKKIAVVNDVDGAYIYDWNYDKAWRIHKSLTCVIEWFRGQEHAVSKGEIANYLSQYFPLNEIPFLTEEIVSKLVSMKLLIYIY